LADDNGVIADTEAQIVTLLAAATVGGKAAFRTVNHWRWQITGPDSFRRYGPFAFVKYIGTPSTNPEGDHDLNQHLSFAVLVGTEISGNADAARIGTGTAADNYDLGVSRLRDVVLDTLQEVHPTVTAADVEYFDYLGDNVEWDEPNRYAISMRFRIDRVTSHTG